MRTVGTVRFWNDGEGWGVIVSPETPSGCWTHFSRVAVAGYRTLRLGQRVELEWEAPGQDGYPFRAIRAWPDGEEPWEAPTETSGSSYRSTLTLWFDRPGTVDK